MQKIDIDAELDALRAKFAARKGRPEYAANVAELKARIAVLEARQRNA